MFLEPLYHYCNDAKIVLSGNLDLGNKSKRKHYRWKSEIQNDRNTQQVIKHSAFQLSFKSHALQQNCQLEMDHDLIAENNA